MTSFTLYRCDHCGQTRTDKKGFVAIKMAPETIYSGLTYIHPDLSVEVCSWDCFLGWVSERAKAEYDQLFHIKEKKK